MALGSESCFDGSIGRSHHVNIHRSGGVIPNGTLTSPSDNLKREGKTHIPRNFLAFTTTREHFVKTYSSTIQKHKNNFSEK